MIKDQPLPATAQGKSVSHPLFFHLTEICAVAFQKAKYATRSLNRIVRDRPVTEPFEFRNQGSLAYLGDWYVEVPDLTILMKHGLMALLLYRKALYDTSKVKGAQAPKGLETG